MALRVYNGRYEIVQHLARGGMAEVFLARDLLLDRPVAIKVLFPEFAADRTFVERFRREASNAQEALTQTGAVMGTATYFSPEQAQGRPIDFRSDVYAMGIVLYEMVVGRPPFYNENPVAVAYQHARERPIPPRQHNPRIPVAFEAIVLKSLAKNPANRYSSAEELRADLMRFRAGRPVVARPAAPAPPPA